MRDEEYYFARRKRTLETVIRAAVNGEDDTAKDLRCMLGLDRKEDRNGDKPQQPREQENAPKA